MWRSLARINVALCQHTAYRTPRAKIALVLPAPLESLIRVVLVRLSSYRLGGYVKRRSWQLIINGGQERYKAKLYVSLDKEFLSSNPNLTKSTHLRRKLLLSQSTIKIL